MLLFHGNLWWAAAVSSINCFRVKPLEDHQPASPFPGSTFSRNQPWPALSSSMDLSSSMVCVLWSYISLVFTPRLFSAFAAVCGLLGYSHFSGANSKEKARTSWQSTNPLDLHLHLLSFFSLCSLCLSLSPCLYVICVKYTVYRNVFVAVWDCLGSSSESLNCGVSLWYIVRYGSAIYELHWREGHCFNPYSSTSLEQLQCGMKTLPFLLSMPT